MYKTNRVKVYGVVTIRDIISGKLLYRYHNTVSTSAIQQFINYAQYGGAVSDYSYILSLVQGNTTISQIQGGLQYVPSSTGFIARFSFIVPPVSVSLSSLQLNVISTFPLTPLAYVNNVKIPINTLFQVTWDINFDISPVDYFTPYLVVALLGVPSTQVTLPANIQSAVQQISNSNYLTAPPSYFATYNGNYVPLSPVFTTNSIQLSYNIVSQQGGVFSNVGIVVTANNGYINVILPLSAVAIQTGQSVSLVYNATWSIGK
ncbi:hypothetical protein SBFV3_gp31 [Sulfolobales Beppu filamentous virus 3]|uniref:Uncharacterized protein n=1 Tax=Sulfolobales Beppu filamentous virus 3 TaxID=2493124 RepID=A0A3Q8Q3Z0_9VIRU|nr:hypothetical protein HOU83_gp31 [Sulfolobales Beppu filamentous virus 3]AZI75866.1 hypothetical protein SBFV3_gp31 [Sulfolobales Beppu filamentous virus 3]